MSPHITVLPASTKAGRETIRALLNSESKPVVRGIYRDPTKAPAEFLTHTNFTATAGDVGANTGLDFTDSDAVFYVPPPTYDGRDQSEWAAQTASNVKRALEQAPKVEKLLLFSAVGSQYDHGIGVLRLNHVSDTILKESVKEVIIVRPGYFHEDWASLLDVAKANPPLLKSWISPPNYKVPMVGLKDVGETCANILLSTTPRPSPYYFKLFGPRSYSALDLKAAVEQVTGKEVILQSVKREHLGEFFAELVPEAHVEDFVGMATAVLAGGIMAGDLGYDENTVRGGVELVDSLRKVYTE